MGVCNSSLGGGHIVQFSTPQDELSRRIDKELEDEKKIKILKILLLGPGESGKSTTLKQMKIIHAEGYSPTDLMSKRDVVYHNLFNGIREAIKEAQNQNLPLEEELMEDIRKIEKHSEKMRTMDIHPIPHEVFQETSKAIERVYASAPIQFVIYRLSNTPVDDAGRYFLEQLSRVTAPDYLPTVQDVLKSRVATQGCVQMSFFIKDFTFNVYDVGGQRSQRKKWLHIFDNVHAVLFITSLSEYNQKLAEDNTTNRMRESLGLFGNICKNEYFKQTAIILFLNKKDLFENKIATFPITDCFPRYKGPQKYDESLAHITKRFLRENGNQKRQVYTHVTCATDTQQIQVVIDSVIDVIIQQTMQKIGIQ